jgi:anaphase-promoting complex subunit 10
MKSAQFSVSSHKPGFGIPELLSEDLNQFWQSDGLQPHFILLQFQKRTILTGISMYINFNQDESYTPKLVSIRGGTCIDTLTEICKKETKEIQGWVDIEFDRIGLFCLQVLVLQNHQNGKDTHVRGLKIHSVVTASEP